MDNIGAGIDFGDAKENPVATGLFNNQMGNRLRLTGPHIRRGVQPVHGFIERRWINRDEAQQAEAVAPTDHIGPDQEEIVARKSHLSLLVYLQRWRAGGRTEQ